MTHPGGCCSSAHSETKALCEDLLNNSENIVGLKVSEEEAKNFSSQVLPPGLLVVHDAPRGGQHHLAKAGCLSTSQCRSGNVKPAFELILSDYFRVESHLASWAR